LTHSRSAAEQSSISSAAAGASRKQTGGAAMKKIALAISALIFASATVCGASPAATSTPPVFIQKQILDNGVQYLSGGVGLNERAQMKRMVKDYNLKLIFDLNSGAYLSFVDVSLQSADGRILVNATSQGPWFYAQLPAGKYRLTATHSGQKQVVDVTVGRNLKTIDMSWKA
jgi:hypothetical protein